MYFLFSVFLFSIHFKNIGIDLYFYSNNAPPCQNGGSCVGVPTHVVPTSGGTGDNQNCQFPFTYQNMSYAKCVEGNEVN